MPLVVISGFPCSGKTTRAQELKKHFEAKGKEVHIVSEEEQFLKAGFDKNSFYKNDRNEKTIRGLLKSEVLRLISPRNLVILDGSNYIKGYRYELYCATKANHSTQCTLEPIVHKDLCWELNEKRGEGEKYARETYDALMLRFEEPDGQNRWDSPLFSVQHGDGMDFEEIERSLFTKEAPALNMSTQNPPLNATNYLHDMNKITKEITASIITLVKKGETGVVSVPGHDDIEIDLSKVSVAKLVSLNRQYLHYCKLNPPSIDNVSQLFVQYLVTNIN